MNYILSFFVNNHILSLIAFLCWPEHITRDLIKESHDRSLRTRVIDANKSFSSSILGEIIGKEGVLLDLACENAPRIVKESAKKHYFSTPVTWLLVSKVDLNTSRIEEVFKEVSILPNSNVYIISNEEAMYEVYKIKNNEPIIVNMIFGKVSEDFGNALPPTSSRRRDLRNVYLKCATIISQPEYFLGWNDLTMKHIDTWPKFTYPIMMNLAEDLNYRNNIIQTDNYGVQLPNGSFDGLCGRLQRNEIEFGITSMFMRKDRWTALDFSAETLELKSSFIFHQPPKSLVTNIFLLPFEQNVWITCVLIYLLVGLLTILTWRVMKAHDGELNKLDPREVTSFILGTICQQGTSISPRLLSIRIMMFGSLVASLFIFTSYSAKIVVLLQTPSTQIKTMSDLAHSPLALGVQETTYKKVYFTESNDSVTQYLYQHKIAPFGEAAYLSVVDGIARMRKSLFAFQVEESSGYDIISKTYTEREKCGLTEIEAFKLPMVAVPIKKYSGYKELFATRLRWHREVGLIDRTKKIWIAQKPQCNEGQSGFVSVGITDCLPAFKVLLFGIPLALAILMVEVIIKNRIKISYMVSLKQC